MLKKYVAVLLTAVSMVCAGCEQQPPVEPAPSVDNPPPVETTTPSAPPDEKVETKSEPPKQTETKPPVEKEATLEDMKVKVYYPDESGLRLVEVEREIEVSKDADKYAAAVETMMTTPSEQELTEIFPKHAKLLSVTVDNGIATVNFDDGLQKHFVGGSAGETFLVGSVVNALTNFDEIKGVQFLIDGKKIDSLAGHMDLSEPVGRMDDLLSNN